MEKKLKNHSALKPYVVKITGHICVMAESEEDITDMVVMDAKMEIEEIQITRITSVDQVGCSLLLNQTPWNPFELEYGHMTFKECIENCFVEGQSS